MSAPVTEKSLAYLRGHNVMTLATAGEDGPWAAAVFYVNEGFTLNFLSASTTRHAANIAANPQVAATVQEDYHDWREIKGVQLDGAAVMLSRTESATASARFAAKFPLLEDLAAAPAELARAFQRMAWYALTPTHVYFIDNSVAFGHRDKVPLPHSD